MLRSFGAVFVLRAEVGKVIQSVAPIRRRTYALRRELFGACDQSVAEICRMGALT